MPRYVIDTNLYVEAITTDEGNEALAAFQRRFAPFLFQHSTVAQEILAGAHSEASYREYHEDWVAPFEALGRVITPSHAAWARAAPTACAGSATTSTAGCRARMAST